MLGRPAKGKVEGLVGYARRNFMVPIPRVKSWDELNAHLDADCRKRRKRRLRGYSCRTPFFEDPVHLREKLCKFL
jgi:transposase